MLSNVSSDDVAKKLPSIPECDTVLDLLVLKGEDLKSEVLKLVQNLFPDWAKGVKQVELQRISGAMTNAVFFLDATNKPRLLLRVYGNGVDQIINREHELEWLSRLSRLNIGPKLLGVFGNGRFEQYLPSTTLTYDDLRDPETSKQIASAIREMHDIITVFPYSECKNSLEVWSDIDKWYKVVMEILPQLLSKSDGWAKVLETYNLERLPYEVEECKRILDAHHSPIVFAHNDTQYGNVLRLEKSHELVIVDFEYSGYNPRGYDFANHFCEWAYNYHAENSANLNLDQYPTYDEQIRFFKAYLETPSKFNNPDINDQVTPESLQKEASMWLMANHIHWGLWGLIQANNSEIDFDYFWYSVQRLNAFRDELAKWK